MIKYLVQLRSFEISNLIDVIHYEYIFANSILGAKQKASSIANQHSVFCLKTFFMRADKWQRKNDRHIKEWNPHRSNGFDRTLYQIVIDPSL